MRNKPSLSSLRGKKPVIKVYTVGVEGAYCSGRLNERRRTGVYGRLSEERRVLSVWTGGGRGNSLGLLRR